MVFSSLMFLYCYLPVCLILYFLARDIKAKNLVLLVLSLIFYAWGEPLWVILLIFSAFWDYNMGVLIGKYRGKKWGKVALICSLCVNLGLLATFKYSGFFVENFNGLTGLNIPLPNIVMPIGISFYTFQTLSYTIDVYRGKVEVQRSFLDFLLFVSLFPQLIAGPILRYSDLAAQLADRKTTLNGAFYGAVRFLCGLGKKVLLANYAGSVVTTLLDGSISSLTVSEAWLGIIMFTFQIYFDFSGYSDMAIGLGRIFGFKYGENFNLPYTSTSLTEFWRRWHISLGSFFRDYVYIPLGGNRKHQLLNIFIVWFLTGFWHGASWNFIFWGLFFFVFLSIEKRFPAREKLPKPIRLVITLFLIVIGWTLFYFNDLGRLGQMFMALFGVLGNPFINDKALMLFTNNLPLLLICAFGSSPIPRTIGRAVMNFYMENKENPRAKLLYAIASSVFSLLMLFFSTASLVGASYNPFLYFRF